MQSFTHYSLLSNRFEDGIARETRRMDVMEIGKFGFIHVVHLTVPIR
jgi:hypothetical protein